MLKKTITYNDFDGNEIVEDFYFHLSAAELAELQLTAPGGGGMVKYLESIVEDEDGTEIIRVFKEILGMSIGRRSENNKSFIKNDSIREEFMGSDAYSQLFIELVTDANAAAAFVNGVMPSDLERQVEISEDGKVVELPAKEVDDDTPAYIRENREPSNKELAAMSKEELQQAFSHRQNLRKNDN